MFLKLGILRVENMAAVRVGDQTHSSLLHQMLPRQGSYDGVAGAVRMFCITLSHWNSINIKSYFDFAPNFLETLTVITSCIKLLSKVFQDLLVSLPSNWKILLPITLCL